MKNNKTVSAAKVQAQIKKLGVRISKRIEEDQTMLEELRVLYKAAGMMEEALELEIDTQARPKPRGPHPLHLRIRRMFEHRDTTKPDAKSTTAFKILLKRLGEVDLCEQVELMERFYAYRSKRAHVDTDHWSHSDTVLMNNWDAKHVTGLDFLKDKSPTPEKKVKGIPEPECDWKVFARQEYTSPSADWDNKTWSDLDSYKEAQERILELCNKAGLVGYNTKYSR